MVNWGQYCWVYVNVQVANGLHEELDTYGGEKGEWSAYFVAEIILYASCRNFWCMDFECFQSLDCLKSIYFVCCSSSYGNTGDINDSNFYVGSILEFVYDYMADVLELKIAWLYD